MRRGISEKSVFVYNPLPTTSDAELLVAAGIDELTQPAHRSPFMLEWQYSAGLEYEYIELKPGERRVLRESDATEWLRELEEQGGVVHDLDATPEQIRALSIAALQKAAKFFSERGSRRLPEVRKKLGMTSDEMEEAKYEHWAYHLNGAKERAIIDHLKTLRSEVAA
jgi:hypothetical protein